MFSRQFYNIYKHYGSKSTYRIGNFSIIYRDVVVEGIVEVIYSHNSRLAFCYC